MKRIHVFCLAALIATAAGLLGSQLVILHATDAQAAPQKNSIDIMQMMHHAKDLPAQSYDAI
jgi:Flp pilus assembly protein CpaB